ncbi:hypothetical protein M885DRAFT_456191 [Pelagophyceae sp. CCMP2097]|nr:hypothetical protein M885DRAFT_456191 [Pelagophyceae sp. CCMP2097]
MPCSGLFEAVFAPTLYRLEAKVAGKGIPAVSTAPAPRLRFASVAGKPGNAFDHALWDAVLKAHVRGGKVDYAGVAADERFGRYVESLAAADVEALAPLEQLALHLNAYNAFCMSHIVGAERAQPGALKSITELSEKGVMAIWDKPAGKIGGTEVTLNDIEHKRLRLIWDEPSLHACIVCASTSCPDLCSAAFVADGLEAQMRARVCAWLSDETKGLQIDAKKRVARLSRIFLWFGNDFEDEHGGAREFCAKYVPATASQEALRNSKFATRHFEYDWSVNRQ